VKESVALKHKSAVELYALLSGATDHLGIGFLSKKPLTLMVRWRFRLVDLATV
jgi:hypothetical protein